MTRGLDLAPGLRYIPGYLDREAQRGLLAAIREVIRDAPLFQPTMPRTGAAFSVAMSNCGPLGWVSDRSGYRYQQTHPTTGDAWPAMPVTIMDAWRTLADYPRPPEACLINYYATAAKMGLHQDRDEEGFLAPVLSLSLGDTCVFRLGGRERREPTRSLRLESGDALLLAGASRLAFHGVDRIIAGTSTLLEEGGRFNLTIRRVTGEPSDERPTASP